MSTKPGRIDPCPFCGNTLCYLDDLDFAWAVVCEECGAHGPTMEDPGDRNIGPELIEKWNRRPGEAAAVHRVLDAALNTGDGSYRP